MEEKLTKSILGQLKASLFYSLSFLKFLIQQKRLEIGAEILVQVVKDVYYLKRKAFLRGSVDEGILELSLDLDREEIMILKAIEHSMRKEEDYFEFSKTLNAEQLLKISEKLENNIE
jgi:hypothetical protein